MRLVLFLNNWGGWQVAKWLHARGENIAGLVVQPENNQRFVQEIKATLAMPPDRIWLGPQLKAPETLSRIRELNPDMGISAWFGYILKPELLQIFPQSCINLHPAFLPWNRGWHTTVFPILDGTPAGATVHYIDAGVDTGDLIAQRRVPVTPTDTGGTMHEKCNRELVDLFKQSWPSIKAGKNQRVSQDHSLATHHGKADLAQFDCFELDREYPARELLNLLRARTYPPYPSAYCIENSQRVYFRLHLSSEEELAGLGKSKEIHRSLPCIELDRQYKSRELLELLVGPAGSVQPSAYFVQTSRRVYVRAQSVAQEDFDPSATPAWMSASQ